MFETAKIRRILLEFEKEAEKLEDDTLFYPIKTIRDTGHFIQLISRFRGLCKLVLEVKTNLDAEQIMREIQFFLDELKQENKTVKSKPAKAGFSWLVKHTEELVRLA